MGDAAFARVAKGVWALRALLGDVEPLARQPKAPKRPREAAAEGEPAGGCMPGGQEEEIASVPASLAERMSSSSPELAALPILIAS